MLGHPVSAPTNRRIYPKPPIVEAVIELRYGVGEGADDLASLQTRLAQEYPVNPAPRYRLEVSTDIHEDQVSASAQKHLEVTMLRSADGARLLGTAPGLLSIH